MQTFYLKTDFIKLGQLLKAVNLVESGAEAKEEILSGRVLVNGEVCTMRGKKIYPQDKVAFNGEEIQIQ